MDGGPPCRSCLREERNSTPGTAGHEAADSGGGPAKITRLSEWSVRRPAVPNEPQFRPDNPRVSCWRKHAPKSAFFFGELLFPAMDFPATRIRPCPRPQSRGPSSRNAGGECHQNIATISPRPAVGARMSARYEGPGAGCSRQAARDCATYADARCRPEGRTRAIGGFRRQRAAEALTLEDPYAAIEAECGDHRALLSGKRRWRPRASPAPSIGPPVGSESEPHRDSDATIGKSCATRPGRTSDSGPCDGTRRNSSAARVPRPPIGYYE